MPNPESRTPSLGQALIPIAVLVFLLASSVYLFGDNSSGGPNQVALFLSASVAAVVGMTNGFRWKELQDGMVAGVSLTLGAIFILMTVGALIGTWIMAGVVPTMIYYGLLILNPSIFFAAACLICAVAALATGSSWTTAGTLGIALVGISNALGLNPGITAGAVISGSYFGDKLSPMSDTTNLAPAMAGTDLFTHIRHMLWTTIPSIGIALVLFGFLGLGVSGNASTGLEPFLKALQDNFNIGWYLLIPPAIVLAMVMRKMPALPALIIGALVGGIFGVVFQQAAILRFVSSPELSTPVALLKGFWIALFDGYTSSTGNAALDDLLTRGGMSMMLSTIWLIICAMMFGAMMERTGMLERIARTILRSAHSTGSLVAATLASSIGSNILASDQYISIVLPGRMYRAEFKKRGLDPRNLSRAVEDAGTMTSPLVPWNTCGAYMAATLGVPTLVYLPYCFANLLSPVISAFYGFTGFTIKPLEEAAGGPEAVPDTAV